MTDPGAAPSVRTALLGTRRIMGSPYTVVVLQEGYHQPTPDGGARADGTVTLLRGPLPMLVDTGGPWGRERLLAALVGEGLAPADIKHVVCTHGHSDHAGNLNLFPAAELLVGFDRSAPGADQYLPVGLVEGRPHALDPGHVEVVATPGHVAAHTSVVVRGTMLGTVVVAGDLFERHGDEDSWQGLSEDPARQEHSRQWVLGFADVVVPGHGAPFRVLRGDGGGAKEPGGAEG